MDMIDKLPSYVKPKTLVAYLVFVDGPALDHGPETGECYGPHSPRGTTSLPHQVRQNHVSDNLLRVFLKPENKMLRTLFHFVDYNIYMISTMTLETSG